MKSIDIILVAPGDHTGLFSLEGVHAESLGLGYLAAVLRKSGFNVEILDRHILNVKIEDFASEVASKSEGRLVGFRGMSGHELKDMNFILDHFRENSVKPLHIAIGGIIPSLVPYEVLRNYSDIDSVICYEGELSFVELALRLQARSSLEKLPGRAYRKENGEIVLSGPSPYVRDLDTLPYPARDTLPFVLKNGGPALVQGSRGCYGQCVFCVRNHLNKKFTGGIWRGRALKAIVREIKELIDKYHVNQYSFVDENFFCNIENGHRKAVEFSSMLKQEGITVPFRLNLRLNDIDEKTLNELISAGLNHISVSIETKSRRILEYHNNSTILKNSIEALRIIRKSGLSLCLGCILFNPETTIEEIYETLLFISEEFIGLNLSSGGIAFILRNFIKIYPETLLYNHYMETELLKRDMFDPYFFRLGYKDERVELYVYFVQKILFPVERIFRKLESNNEPFIKQLLVRIDEKALDWALLLLIHIESNNLHNQEEVEDYVSDMECEIYQYCYSLENGFLGSRDFFTSS